MSEEGPDRAALVRAGSLQFESEMRVQEFDVAVLIVGAAFLRWFNSRAAAVVLLLLAVVGAAVTVANRFGLALGGGNNVILAAIMVWAGVRSVQVTFKLHRLAAAEAQNSLVRT
jgi:hypothetical protein